MFSRIPLALLLLTVSAAAFAAPFAGAPISNVVYTGAPWTQEQPQAASDGTNFLIAWRDNRRDTGYETIYAARVSASGQALDAPTAIAIPDPQPRPLTSWTNAMPAVAWTGAVYIVAWDEFQSHAIRFVRIDRDGHVLDATPRSFASSGTLGAAAAASFGNGAMLVYGSDSVHAALFDRDGNIVTNNVAFSRGVVDDNPVIAATNDAYVVAWRRWDGTQSNIMVARVLSDGTIARENLVATSLANPVLASNGNELALLYIDANKQLAFVHLDASATAVAHTTLGTSNNWPFYDNVIARYGSGYIMTSRGTANGVTGVVLDLNGQRLGEIKLTTRNIADGAIGFAANAQSTIVAWPEARFGGTIDRDVFARAIGSDNEALVSTAAARQVSPRIASSGALHLAAWVEYRGGTEESQLRIERLALDGTPLDGEGVTLADHVSIPPAVSFDGENFVVAWAESSAIRIARVSPDGQLLDGPQGRVAVDVSPVSIALGSNGHEVLLAWSGFTNSKGFVRAARVKSDGSIELPYIDLPATEASAADISVTGTPDTWLVAWSQTIYRTTILLPPPLPPVHDVLAARLSSALNLIDAIPLYVATQDRDESHVSVATNGHDFAIAWDDYTNVLGRTLVSGTLGETITIARGTSPSLVWRGDHYAVAWENSGDLFLGRFVQQTQATPFDVDADAKSHVVITPAGGNLVALFERLSSEPLYGNVTRVFVRNVAPSRARSVRH